MLEQGKKHTGKECLFVNGGKSYREGAKKIKEEKNKAIKQRNNNKNFHFDNNLFNKTLKKIFGKNCIDDLHKWNMKDFVQQN